MSDLFRRFETQVLDTRPFHHHGAIRPDVFPVYDTKGDLFIIKNQDYNSDGIAVLRYELNAVQIQQISFQQEVSKVDLENFSMMLKNGDLYWNHVLVSTSVRDFINFGEELLILNDADEVRIDKLPDINNAKILLHNVAKICGSYTSYAIQRDGSIWKIDRLSWSATNLNLGISQPETIISFDPCLIIFDCHGTLYYVYEHDTQAYANGLPSIHGFPLSHWELSRMPYEVTSSGYGVYCLEMLGQIKKIGSIDDYLIYLKYNGELWLGTSNRREGRKQVKLKFPEPDVFVTDFLSLRKINVCVVSDSNGRLWKFKNETLPVQLIETEQAYHLSRMSVCNTKSARRC